MSRLDGSPRSSASVHPKRRSASRFTATMLPPWSTTTMASGAASSICRNRLSCMRGVVMVRYPDLGLQLEVKTSLPVPAGRVDAPVHVQLLKDVVHMVLGRRHFDAQMAGDLFVGHALIDELKDLAFPVGQCVDGAVFLFLLSFVSVLPERDRSHTAE